MRRIRTRIGSILLSMVLVLSLLPVTALAGDGKEAKYGDQEYDTLGLAVAAAKMNGGGTIELLTDVELDAQLDLPDGVTLDGQGKTISVGVDSWSSANPGKYVVVCGINVTVKNVTIDAGKKASGALQFYDATGGRIEGPVTLQNATGLGLNINASQVTATGTITYENNGANSGINVSWGDFSGGTQPTHNCTFDASAATLKGVAGIYTGSSDVENAGNNASKFSIMPPADFATATDAELEALGGAFAILCAPAAAEVNGTKYIALATAIGAAQSGQTVKLLSDVALNTAVNVDGNQSYSLLIDKSITLDGASGSGVRTMTLSTDRGIAVKGTENASISVTLQNLKIVQTSGRSCIETRGNINALTLKNVALDASSSPASNNSGNTQVLTIGGDQDTSAQVTISDSTITSSKAGYCVVTFNPVKMGITGSTLTGWAPLYFKGVDSSAGSGGSSVTVTGGSGLYSRNDNGDGDGWNQFGAVVFEDNNVTVTLENAVVDVYSQDPNEQQEVISFNNLNANEGGLQVSDNRVFITDGAKISTNGNRAVFTSDIGGNKIEVSGGYFTFDPSAYLANGLAAVASDKDGYAYMVGEAGSNPAAVVAGDADVSVAENITGEDEKELAESVTTALTDPGEGGRAEPSIGTDDLNAAAGTVANQNTVTHETKVEGNTTVQEALEALPGTPETITNPAEAITIVVQPYLDIKVTDVTIDNEAGTKTVTLDITPMYITVATTANLDQATPDTIVIAGENVSGANAIQVGEAKELPISKPVEVTLSLPEDFTTKDTLYVKHVKDGGATYYYKGDVSENVLTFINPHGFSEFTLMSTNEAKAEIGDVGYPSLLDAINAVTSGGTIKVLGSDAQSAVVSREVTFTLDGTATITAGSGYQLTKNGSTYTVTRLPETSDEPSSGGSSSGGSGSSDDDGDYSVSVPSGSSIQGGSITVSPRSADKGDTVTITVKPDDGYVLDELTVTTRAGAKVDLTRKSDTRYTFTMPGSSVVIDVSFVREGTSAEMDFTDVADDFWAYSEIQWAYDNGFMNGTSASTFNPNGTVNRQQVWMILARMAGADPANMTEAKAWAVESGISDGTNPTGAVTRQQLVALLYRFASQNDYNVSGKADLSGYPDAASVASYAAEPMAWAVAGGIIGGTTQGTLNPAGASNRAQLAVILWRFYQTTAG